METISIRKPLRHHQNQGRHRGIPRMVPMGHAATTKKYDGCVCSLAFSTDTCMHNLIEDINHHSSCMLTYQMLHISCIIGYINFNMISIRVTI
jgi:hypothetical protein